MLILNYMTTFEYLQYQDGTGLDTLHIVSVSLIILKSRYFHHIYRLGKQYLLIQDYL